MSNAENRRSLSLLESLHSEPSDPKDAFRRARREGDATPARSRPRRRTGSTDDAASGDNVETQASFMEAAVPIEKGSPPPDDRDDKAAPLSAEAPTFPSRLPGVVSPSLNLPQPRGKRPIGGIVSFVVCVLLPIIVASIYYIGYASDQYVVEWRFVVRNTSTAAATSTASSSLTALLGISSSVSAPDNYIVTDYITSGQAVADLQAKIKITDLYSRQAIDSWSRFDNSQPIEKFVKYWQYMATASFDQITGIAIAQIRAFSSDDAYLIAKTLVALSEDLINESVQRPQWEAVRYAETEVKRAEERLKGVRAALSEYRSKESVIDPSLSVVLSNSTLVQSLRNLLVQYQTDLAAMQKGGLTANSAQVQNTRVRIKSTEEQLRLVEAEVSKAKQGDSSLSEVVGRYEQLSLELGFAQNYLTATMQSLEQARSNALARHLFVDPFVHPLKPQSSTYPNRFVAILTVAGACFLLWTIALLVARSIREQLS